MDRREFLKLAATLAAAVAAMPTRALAGPERPEAPMHTGNFRAVYLDEELRERFFPFLTTVFHLYPEQRFHALILEAAQQLESDQDVYKQVQARLPEIKPLLGSLTYALPALRTQKAEMTRQALHFLGDNAEVDGYLEIGSTGRYMSDLRKHAAIRGPIHVLNDTAPSYSPVDILERGGIFKRGEFHQLGNYEAFVGTRIPAKSLELVTNFIGFHHCPPENLEGFLDSIRAVLKPGGRLLLRDHDVDNAEDERIVGLAHDVFNAGVDLSWKDNDEQLRAFRSFEAWTELLRKAGFRPGGETLAQTGDPTKNLMAEFVRV